MRRHIPKSGCWCGAIGRDFFLNHVQKTQWHRRRRNDVSNSCRKYMLDRDVVTRAQRKFRAIRGCNVDEMMII